MTLAVVCIVGHFSKTMLIFLLPQFLNFIYSFPQLYPKGIPCPRHRMPAYDIGRGIVKNSYTEFKPADLSKIGALIFRVLRTFRLAHIMMPEAADGTVRMSNLTLINFMLYVCGPMREDVLCVRLLALQVSCSAICFAVRFGLASYVFDVVL